MGTFKKAISIAFVNFHRWKCDWRIWITLLFTVVILFRYLDAFLQYGLDYGKKATFCVLPMLFHGENLSVGSAKIILYVGMLTLLCDAPFFHPVTPYMILRSKRNAWWLGECCYIMGTAFFYMLFIMLVSAVMMLPVVTLKNEWGEVVKGFAFGDEAYSNVQLTVQYGYMPIATPLVQYIYPYAAQLYTFVTGWASFTFVGLVAYLVSIIQKNIFWSLGTAAFFIFLEPVINGLTWTGDYWIQAFSPISWSSMEYLDLLSRANWISFPFVLLMYPLLIIILMFVIGKCSRRVIIEIR